MQIDWFTFAAQIVNFLILLLLLKRFLYGPILKAISDREAEIASRFDDARQQMTAAESARTEFESRMAQLTHAKEQLLTEAANEVAEWKEHRLSETRAEVEESRVEWYLVLDRERAQLRSDLTARYREHSLRLAKGILSCLADADGQQAIVDAFVRHVRTGRVEAKTTPPHPEAGADELTTILSAFALSDVQKTAVREAVEVLGRTPKAVEFRVDPTLISGIELRASDHEISWNARESLDFLADEFSRELDEILALPAELRVSSEAAHAT